MCSVAEWNVYVRSSTQRTTSFENHSLTGLTALVPLIPPEIKGAMFLVEQRYFGDVNKET